MTVISATLLSTARLLDDAIGDDIEQIIGAGGAGVDVGDTEPVGSADELPRKLAAPS